MKCVNNEKREELGQQPPFKVYFQRKSNEFDHCGLLENRGSLEVRKVLKSTKNDFDRLKKLRSKTNKKQKKRAVDSNESVAKRIFEYFRNVQNKPKTAGQVREKRKESA